MSTVSMILEEAERHSKAGAVVKTAAPDHRQRSNNQERHIVETEGDNADPAPAPAPDESQF